MVTMCVCDKVSSLVLALTLCISIIHVRSNEMSPSVKLGRDMTSKSYDAVCYYETMKVLTKMNYTQYQICSQTGKKLAAFSLNPGGKIPEEAWEGQLGDYLKKALPFVPRQYEEECLKDLTNPKSPPAKDEGKVLEDSGKNYPFKGFAHCLISLLGLRHGPKAVDDVIVERIRPKKTWRDMIFERENMHRSLHGVPPFTLLEDLNKAAQAYADEMATKCNFGHSRPGDRKFNGKDTGENIAASYIEFGSNVNALGSANGFYEEIRDYPYPEGYNGDTTDIFFLKIGHFTQSIWKNTRQVGYGYAENPECKKKGRFPSTAFIVARYFPSGNAKGYFQDNVPPPKDKSIIPQKSAGGTYQMDTNSELDIGMLFCGRAYDAVCWYEFLRSSPLMDIPSFRRCLGTHTKEEKMARKDRKSVDELKKSIKQGSWRVLAYLPKPYQDECTKYLDNENAPAPADEGAAVNDEGKAYFHKSYAHCLMYTLRKRHGGKAIDDVKNVLVYKKVSWQQLTLDQMNKYRTRHSVPPLQTLQNLTDSAQALVDNAAAACKPSFTPLKEMVFKGDQEGERYFLSKRSDEFHYAALEIIGGFYDQFQGYPFPQGYTGNGKDDAFKKFAPGAEIIWKSTKYVGIGMARNENCDKERKPTDYFVLRYYPRGAEPGQFKDNVFPPTS